MRGNASRHHGGRGRKHVKTWTQNGNNSLQFRLWGGWALGYNFRHSHRRSEGRRVGRISNKQEHGKDSDIVQHKGSFFDEMSAMLLDALWCFSLALPVAFCWFSLPFISSCSSQCFWILWLRADSNAAWIFFLGSIIPLFCFSLNFRNFVILKSSVGLSSSWNLCFPEKCIDSQHDTGKLFLVIALHYTTTNTSLVLPLPQFGK